MDLPQMRAPRTYVNDVGAHRQSHLNWSPQQRGIGMHRQPFFGTLVALKIWRAYVRDQLLQQQEPAEPHGNASIRVFSRELFGRPVAPRTIGTQNSLAAGGGDGGVTGRLQT